MLDLPSYFAPPSPAYRSRREFLARAGGGLGLLALADLLQASEPGASATGAANNPLAPKKPHYAAKAKSVIWLFMNGGPSHVDSWDYKPELIKRDARPLAGFH